MGDLAGYVPRAACWLDLIPLVKIDLFGTDWCLARVLPALLNLHLVAEIYAVNKLHLFHLCLVNFLGSKIAPLTSSYATIDLT